MEKKVESVSILLLLQQMWTSILPRSVLGQVLRMHLFALGKLPVLACLYQNDKAEQRAACQSKGTLLYWSIPLPILRILEKS
mmetsp:Transcript_147134/g.256796  ORF Transcript_147134/g.256796 Transcript_147134/m.256796 type:complete len:82 (+) Transcript_147134:604-849(+)